MRETPAPNNIIYDKSTALLAELFFKACIFGLHFKGMYKQVFYL